MLNISRKYWIAFALCVAILVNLSACGTTVPESPVDDPTDPPAAETTAPATEEPNTPVTEPPTVPPTDAPVTEPPEEFTEAGVTFTAVEETVYATCVVNIRTGPGTEYDWIGQLDTGETILRTGIGSNGWSRVVYNGEIAYMHGDYLAVAETADPVVDPDVTFEDVEETVYTTVILNIRTGPGTEYEWIGQLPVGASVLRTGIGSNGWSRIIYNGEVAYVYGDYVTTEPGADRLVGSWISIYRDEWTDHLVTDEYVFYSDGTGSTTSHEYVYYSDNPEGTEGDGWSLAGMGYFESSFTYTLQGDQLEITFDGYRDEMGDWIEPDTWTYTVYQLDETWLIFSDRTYVRDDGLSLREVCEALDVDYSLPDPEGTPAQGSDLLAGSWISVHRDHDLLFVQKYTFDSEGNGSVSGRAMWYDKDGWEVSGVDGPYGFSYVYRDDYLELTFAGYEDDFGGWNEPYTRSYTVYQLDDNTLVLSDDWGTYIPDTDASLEELCAMLGVDYSAPKQ